MACRLSAIRIWRRRCPPTRRRLYARNLLDFLKLIVTKEGTLDIDLADDIVAATLLARDGEVARIA